eukprot:gene14299-biopygen559
MRRSRISFFPPASFSPGGKKRVHTTSVKSQGRHLDWVGSPAPGLVGWEWWCGTPLCVRRATAGLPIRVRIPPPPLGSPGGRSARSVKRCAGSADSPHSVSPAAQREHHRFTFNNRTKPVVTETKPCPASCRISSCSRMVSGGGRNDPMPTCFAGSCLFGAAFPLVPQQPDARPISRARRGDVQPAVKTATLQVPLTVPHKCESVQDIFPARIAYAMRLLSGCRFKFLTAALDPSVVSQTATEWMRYCCGWDHLPSPEGYSGMDLRMGGVPGFYGLWGPGIFQPTDFMGYGLWGSGGRRPVRDPPPLVRCNSGPVPPAPPQAPGWLRRRRRAGCAAGAGLAAPQAPGWWRRKRRAGGTAGAAQKFAGCEGNCADALEKKMNIGCPHQGYGVGISEKSGIYRKRYSSHGVSSAQNGAPVFPVATACSSVARGHVYIATLLHQG